MSMHQRVFVAGFTRPEGRFAVEPPVEFGLRQKGGDWWLCPAGDAEGVLEDLPVDEDADLASIAAGEMAFLWNWYVVRGVPARVDTPVAKAIRSFLLARVRPERQGVAS